MVNKDEFLASLKESLLGEVPESEIRNNIEYYQNYITDDSKLEQLGNPRLIAKTIIDSYKASDAAKYNKNNSHNKAGYSEGNYSFNKERYENQHNESMRSDYNSQNNNGNNSNWNINYTAGSVPWYYKLLGTILLILLVITLVIVGGVVLNLFFTVILPIILLAVIVKMVMKIVKQR